ncbi:MAG: hypothetical protein ACKV19_12845 [Verrucomicrobiales bacterium]
MIRQLMERATVYRSISAPVALVGGVVALGLAWWQHDRGMTWVVFRSVWLALFAVLSVLNLALMWRDAARRGLPLFNAGMRLALRALVPPLLVGGLLGLVIGGKTNDMGFVACLWALCYGLALLATATFAPPSIHRLGRAFVAGGLIAFVGNQAGFFSTGDINFFATAFVMGGLFGLLHVLYGVAVLWPARRSPR